VEHYGWAQHTGGADAATRESSACAAQGFASLLGWAWKSGYKSVVMHHCSSPAGCPNLPKEASIQSTVDRSLAIIVS
jgi:hypothetical protein